MAATVVAAGLFIGIIVVADALRRRRSRKGVPTAMPARSDDDDETALQDDRQAGDRMALEIVPSRSPSEQAEKRHFRSARLSATSDSDVARLFNTLLSLVGNSLKIKPGSCLPLKSLLIGIFANGE